MVQWRVVWSCSGESFLGVVASHLVVQWRVVWLCSGESFGGVVPSRLVTCHAILQLYIYICVCVCVCVCACVFLLFLSCMSVNWVSFLETKVLLVRSTMLISILFFSQFRTVLDFLYKSKN